MQQHDDHGRQVDERARGVDARRRAHPHRQVDAGAREQPLHVAAPADGHRHRADRVFEDQVPADDPGEQLAQRRIGVGVGAAGDRNHRGELGVAERREPAGQAGEEVGHHDGRPGLVGRGGAGEHEDAGADDRADAQQRQVPGGRLRRRALLPCSTSPTSCSIDFVLSRFESIQSPSPFGWPAVERTRPQKPGKFDPPAGSSAMRKRRARSAGGSSPPSRSLITATDAAPAASTPGRRGQRDAADGHERHARRCCAARRVRARPRGRRRVAGVALVAVAKTGPIGDVAHRRRQGLRQLRGRVRGVARRARRGRADAAPSAGARSSWPTCTPAAPAPRDIGAIVDHHVGAGRTRQRRDRLGQREQVAPPPSSWRAICSRRAPRSRQRPRRPQRRASGPRADPGIDDGVEARQHDGRHGRGCSGRLGQRRGTCAGGANRSMKCVLSRPATKSGSLRIFRWSGMLVLMPSMTVIPVSASSARSTSAGRGRGR